MEDSHPAIIDKETFELAKKELKRRRDIKDMSVGGSRYSSKYPFSCLLECGTCGHKLRRQLRTVGSGEKVPYWCCANRVVNSRSVCNSHHVREDTLEATYLEALRSITGKENDVTAAIQSEVDALLSVENGERLQAIENEIITLQEASFELLKQKQALEIGDAEYSERIKEFGEQMKSKEKLREALQGEQLKYAELFRWLGSFEEDIENGKMLTSTDSDIMRRLIERIVVREDGIELYLKCGVRVDQKYVR